MENKPQSLLGDDPIAVKAQAVESKLRARYAKTPLKPPTEYIRFFAQAAQSFMFPPALQRALDFSGDIEVQILNIVKAFQLFGDDLTNFHEMIARKRAEDPKQMKHETSVRTYGVENSRILLCAVAVCAISRGKNFEWDTVALQPKTAPDQFVKHAIKASTFSNPTTVTLAFSAGLVFDILAAVAQKLVPESKAVLGFIDATVDQELKTAQIAMSTAKHTSDLKLANYLYAACFLAAAGRCMFSILKPEMVGFYEKLREDDLPNSAQFVVEEARFGAISELFGSMICSYFSSFEQIREAVYFCREPYVLKHRGEKDLHRLASFICLANHLSRHNVKMSSPEDGRIHEKWLRPEIQDIGLPPATLISVMKQFAG